jgi:hypothetical protein
VDNVVGLPFGPELTPEEFERLNAEINELLAELGHQREDIAGWWNFVVFPELGGRTIARAWLDGDHQKVRHLVVHLYEQSEESARRIAADPERTSDLRRRITEIDRRHTA